MSTLKKSILVVGDWVVDENWLVTKETSSPKLYSGVGKERYCSRKTSVNSQILSLCAAGGVTRMLHSFNNEQISLDIYGLGFWEPADTNFLSSLCSYDKKLINQTPLNLQGMEERPNDDSSINPPCKGCIKLYSLAKADSGTWRVIRIHSQIGPQPPQLIKRYDWEISPDIKKSKWHHPDLIKNITSTLNSIDKIDLIIVVDHQKGSVTEELIDAINEHEKSVGAHWYVRTKDYQKSYKWINSISTQLKLLFLGPTNVELENDPWFLGQHLSYDAIKWMIEKARSPKSQKIDIPEIENKPDLFPFSLVVFHEDNKFVSLIPRGICDPDDIKELVEKGPIFYLTKKAPKPSSYTVGSATVLFAAFIACLEGINTTDGRSMCLSKDSVVRALNRSFHWSKLHEDNLNTMPFDEDAEMNFSGLSGHFCNILKDDPGNYGFHIKAHSVVDELNSWQQALKDKDIGIINSSADLVSLPKKNPYKKFQIWRGWSHVEGYIAITKKHKEDVAKLVKSIRNFREDPNPRRSLSSIIIAEPGWGKTFFVERLSRQMDMEYRAFSITQLGSIDDLMACFDTISSIQTQKPDKPLLIFWDEINSQVETQNIYSYFLGPIWNGVYRRGSQTFQLRPCVWIFASSKEIPKSSNKGSDFLSRINGPQLNITKAIGGSPKGLVKLERLYIAVSLLKYHHPGLLLVSDKILQYLYNIIPNHGIRSIDFVISKFQRFNHGKLDIDSKPNEADISTWIDIHKSCLNKNIKRRTGEFIRVYDEPPEE